MPAEHNHLSRAARSALRHLCRRAAAAGVGSLRNQDEARYVFQREIAKVPLPERPVVTLAFIATLERATSQVLREYRASLDGKLSPPEIPFAIALAERDQNQMMNFWYEVTS